MTDDPRINPAPADGTVARDAGVPGAPRPGSAASEGRPAEDRAASVRGPSPSGPSRDPSEPRRRTGARDGERIDYARYIGSAAWLSSPARAQELLDSGRRCRICDGGAPEARIEVHHRTYARLGREDARDLTTLCGECHREVTAFLRRRRYADVALPRLTDTPRVLPGRAVSAASAPGSLP